MLRLLSKRQEKRQEYENDLSPAERRHVAAVVLAICVGVAMQSSETHYLTGQNLPRVNGYAPTADISHVVQVDAVIINGNDETIAAERSPYTSATLQAYYAATSEAYWNETLGQVSLSLGSVTSQEITPKGRDASGQPCVTNEQVAETVRGHSQGRLGYVAVFANHAWLCEPASAYASNVDDTKFTAYKPNTSMANEFYPGPMAHLIAHETGHNLGLSHSTLLTTGVALDRDGYYVQLSARTLELKDIGQYLRDGHLRVINEPYPTGDDGAYAYQEDLYGYEGSVMGRGIGQGLEPTDTFTATELHELAPKRFWYESMQVNGETVSLGYGETQPSGVVTRIPYSHPLRQIDPTIDTLVFGLDITRSYGPNYMQPPGIDNRRYQLQMIAIGSEQQYVIGLPIRDPIESVAIEDATAAQTECQEGVVYIDDDLGVVVSAGYRPESGYFVRARERDDRAAQAMIARQQKIYAASSHNEFGDLRQLFVCA